MSRQFVVSFPPEGGGLTADEVALLLAALDEDGMSQGRITAPGTGGLDDEIRTGQVQWVPLQAVGEGLFSHLFTLAAVANEERGWNFELAGIARALQAVRYAAEGRGQHYDWHVDWGTGNSSLRKLTLVAHLSPPDSFRGGELQLTTSGKPIAAYQAAGTVTVFPSFLLHRVTPVNWGCRRAAVAWVLGPSFR